MWIFKINRKISLIPQIKNNLDPNKEATGRKKKKNKKKIRNLKNVEIVNLTLNKIISLTIIQFIKFQTGEIITTIDKIIMGTIITKVEMEEETEFFHNKVIINIRVVVEAGVEADIIIIVIEIIEIQIQTTIIGSQTQIIINRMEEETSKKSHITSNSNRVKLRTEVMSILEEVAIEEEAIGEEEDIIIAIATEIMIIIMAKETTIIIIIATIITISLKNNQRLSSRKLLLRKK
jgi:hypothetical protein